MIYRVETDGLVLYVLGTDVHDAEAKAEQLAVEIRAAGRAESLPA
jgi:hypothetical protein